VDNNVLAEAQNGFRKNKSTDTGSQTFIESIQDALDTGLHATGLFFDLSKAYNVINHDILLDKLNAYGIRGESYLSNYLQSVEIKETECSNSVRNSYSSSCKTVEHGMPQDSLSSRATFLFLLYINDITETLQGTKMVLFADDTNLLITGKDEFDLQHKIINVMKEKYGFEKNNLIINTVKATAVISFSTYEIFSKTAENTFRNIKITHQSELRFLGIYIMENLTWGTHA
jgi:hypothetical protein